ncbi:methyltransferase domain-containing protein [Thermosulfurimonas marina]|uniref:methyltransferase domain-containing protein n=1 Tax=Thermosulfurimonas marina TaxID=2047767 RepID=UPI001FE61780|nr:methyltransferase domain-containing protein [Thermosulfurimonas marina]
MLSRELLRRRFRRALPGYEKQARIQAEAAARLLEAVCGISSSWPRILEVGCGPGLFTRPACERLEFEIYLACDLLPECRSKLPRGVFFVVADGEAPPVSPEAFHLVVSSSVIQWFRRPREGLLALARALAPGGVLAVSTFGPETLKEMPGRRRPPGLLSLETWLSFKPPSFRLLAAERALRRISWESPGELLRYLKETGVAGGLPPGELGPLRRWLSGPGPFHLTFELETFLWQRVV